MLLICHTVYLSDISCSKEMSVACHEKNKNSKELVTPFTLLVYVIL